MINSYPNIYAIVVTYMGRRWYDRCFSSLQNSGLPVKIIVVDNTQGNEDADYIKSHYPDIHLIKSEENLGFGKANNIGMRYAFDHGCDYVFLLNQDAWIQSDTMERLVTAAEQHPEFGIIGPVQCTKELNKVLDGVIALLSYPEHTSYDLFSDLMIGTVKDIYSVREINAAAWLLPRKTLETVGGFNPIFLHYGEDWNYMSRVLYHGLKIGLMPKVHVVHDCIERVEHKQGFEMGFDKWLLQRATDILYPDDNVTKMKRHYRRKAVFKLLMCHKTTFIENWSAYKYLKRHYYAIMAAREHDKNKGKNWL